jgi:hypothetical protein
VPKKLKEAYQKVVVDTIEKSIFMTIVDVSDISYNEIGDDKCELIQYNYNGTSYCDVQHIIAKLSLKKK